MFWLIDWLTNHRRIDDYNDMPTEHVISLEYLTYFIVLHCVLAAFCQLLLNEYCIVLYCTGKFHCCRTGQLQMLQIPRRWHFGHSTKSSIQGCTNFTRSTTPYLPLQQLWNDASVQLATSPVLVGPACQITCLKLCWLLSVIKTFCDFLVSSDYGHW